MNTKMKLPDRLTPGLLLVPLLMFLGRVMYDGIIRLLGFLLETYGNEMQLVQWEHWFWSLDRARSFGGYCAFCLIVTLIWIPLTAREKHLSRKARFAWCGSFLVFAVILLGIFLRQLGGVTESGRRLECFSNLRQIHVALQMYADDHSGWLPPDLKTLRPGYLDNDPVYHCPAREGKSEVTDYEYYGRGHKISDPPFLLMAEHDGNHQFHYRNMMLSNGERCSRHVPLKKPGK